jgi:hypothetical protein
VWLWPVAWACRMIFDCKVLVLQNNFIINIKHSKGIIQKAALKHVNKQANLKYS